MHPAIAFRLGCIAFLFGVGTASIGIGAGWILIAAFPTVVILIALHFSRRRKLLARKPESARKFLVFAVIVSIAALGALYDTWHTARYKNTAPPRYTTVDVTGLVTSNPYIASGRQEFIVQDKALGHRYLVKGRMHPKVSYGDEVRIRGTVTYPETLGRRGRLMRQGVYGTLSFPAVQITARGARVGVRGRLYAARNTFRDALIRILPSDEAALVNGVVLGGYSGLGADLVNAMRRSGTMHLVALSGYNVAIVASLVMTLCRALFARRTALIVSVGIIALFVLMTGAEASVVRAAVMGFIGTAAFNAGRARDQSTAIAAAAALMVLMNPKMLVFDAGFQLSFLALLGIVYVRPLVKRFSKFKNKGFLSWKENLLTTVSAQLTVTPLLIAQFGAVPLAAVPANLAVLWLIPGIMLMGFITAIVGIVAYPLALPLGFLLHAPLAYVIAVIKLFG